MDIENLLLLQTTDIKNIIELLNNRYDKNNIYTYAGKILIALNPFQKTSLYSKEMMYLFLNNMNYNKPHLYELANDAITCQEKDLAFLISGESGSGKTESTKRLLDYFAEYYKDENGILSKILNFNGILEAFGNASTIRNHNSSRFGKFIKVSVNNGKISARIKTYLLEKIRIVSENLTNYHIFYSFGYKNNIPDYFQNPRQDWDSGYLLRENLKKNWIENNLGENLWNEIENIMNFLIKLLENKVSPSFLDKHLNFLSINDINNVLSFKTINTGEETIKSELSIGESKTVMQTIVMTLYDKLFERIVFLINDKLGEDLEVYSKSFGILDIFGFEVFGVNGFEQLCINYTNERLQSIFNKYVFEEEIKMFEEEGILKERVNFENNSHILDFFDKKQNGFFPLLDEKSILNANDNDLERTLPKNDKVVKFKLGKFMIKHYAENVEYEWGDFSLKNIERANSDILEFCNKIYKNINIFNSFIKKTTKRGSIGNQTITNQFRQSLNSLIDELDKSKLYFIRCIKPNEENLAGNWVNEKVEKQLNYCGIISALELARQSFPVRMLKEDFLRRYDAIYLRDGYSGEEWMKKIDFGDFLVGKTRVFYTKEKQKELNKFLYDAQKELVEKLIYSIKRNFYMMRWKNLKNKTIILQNNYKCYIAKKDLRIKKSIVKIGLVLISFFERREIYNMKVLVNKLERAIKLRKKKIRSRGYLGMRIIVWLIRRGYVKKVMDNRDSLEGIIRMKVDLAKYELDKFYREKVEFLENRVRELEKYEGLYNDLSGLINQNNESLIMSRMTKTKSEENFPLVGIMEESEMKQSVIINEVSGLYDVEEMKMEYMGIIQNLTKRVEYEFDRFQTTNRYYEELQFEFQGYKADIKEAQLLMSEKMYRMHNENIMLREENVRLTREFNRNYGKSWIQKLFT